jgi:hypothetical protein
MEDQIYKQWDKLIRRRYRRNFAKMFRSLRRLTRVRSTAKKMNIYVTATATAAHYFCLTGWDPNSFWDIWSTNFTPRSLTTWSGGGATGRW